MGGGNYSNASAPDWLEELRLSRKVMQQYLGQVVMVFGICANSINMVILSQKRMRITSTNCYLLVLAAYDVLYLALSGFLNWSVVEFPNVKNEKWYLEACSYIMPLANLISNGAAWLVCAFTLERFIAVCLPIKGRVWCTTKRAKWIIVGVCSSSAAVTFPEFFPQIKQDLYEIGYYWINSCLFTFIPILALSVFNSLLIHAVVEASRTRQEMQQVHSRDSRRGTLRISDDESRSQILNNKQDRSVSEQQRLTVMLIVVVIVFLVCQSPAALNLLFRSYLKLHRISLETGDENLRRIFGGFSNFLVQLNHASNFIVYSMFSTKFRNTFKRVFCSCVPQCELASSSGTTVIHAAAPNDIPELSKFRRNSSLSNRTRRVHNHNDAHNCYSTSTSVRQPAIVCTVSNGSLHSCTTSKADSLNKWSCGSGHELPRGTEV